MAVGVQVLGAQLLNSIGGAVASAWLSLQSAPAWTLAPQVASGPPGIQQHPTPAFTHEAGLGAPVHDLVWFEHIHVIPRFIDLGPVGSKTQVLVEVWNAFRRLAKSLTSITVVGSDGVAIADPPTFPFHVAATESGIWAVNVEDEGSPSIDAIATWIFVGILSSGTDLHLLGFRAIPFAFDPNMENPIVERLGYLTDLLVSTKGMEQRIQLREVPIGSISYSVLFHDLREAQMANALLHGNQGRPFGIPRWQFRTVLTSGAAIGSVTLFCDPQNLPFEVGGLLLLWTSAFHWEARVIDQVLSDRITLSLALRGDWPAGTPLFPMLLGRAINPAFEWPSLAVGSQDVVFDVEGFRP